MIRDPSRINRIVELLRARWHQNPDMRLGQLVVNITGSSDPFHVEDDITEAKLLKADWRVDQDE